MDILYPHGRNDNTPTENTRQDIANQNHGVVTTYEVAELLNLQAVRERARTDRHPAVKTIQSVIAKGIQASVSQKIGRSIGS